MGELKEMRVQITVPAQLDGNFAEVKQELENMMTAYEGLEVTENNIPERKKDVATLRKVRKAIDDRRKQIKTEYEKPYKEFEAKCKELTGLIDNAVSGINEGLNAYEQKRIAEKEKRIAEIYVENIGEYAEYLPPERVRRKEWTNKTCAEKEIIADIQTALSDVKRDISVITELTGEYADECLRVYKVSGSIEAAIRRHKDLESARKIVEKKESEAKPVEPIATEKPVDAFTFRVFNAEDYESVKGYMEIFDIDYEEMN